LSGDCADLRLRVADRVGRTDSALCADDFGLPDCGAAEPRPGSAEYGSVAALVLLACNPESLFDPSFQLTFLAVLTIAGIGVPLFARTTGPMRAAWTT